MSTHENKLAEILKHAITESLLRVLASEPELLCEGSRHWIEGEQVIVGLTTDNEEGKVWTFSIGTSVGIVVLDVVVNADSGTITVENIEPYKGVESCELYKQAFNAIVKWLVW